MRKITHRLLKASKGGWAEDKAVHKLFIEARQYFDKLYPNNKFRRHRKQRTYEPVWKTNKRWHDAINYNPEGESLASQLGSEYGTPVKPG